MNGSVLRDKSKDFAKEIISMCKKLNSSKVENVLTNQLLRSGTSIGANIYEAQYAQSKLDFISKLEIALKECYESEYWLELLNETGYLSEMEFKSLISACKDIRYLLVSSCKTLKNKIK